MVTTATRHMAVAATQIAGRTDSPAVVAHLTLLERPRIAASA
jgi:hypothetical protein